MITQKVSGSNNVVLGIMIVFIDSCDLIFRFCSGIGIVNAVEVLNAFPEEDGLQKFREWIESPDPSILGKVGGKEGREKRSNGSSNAGEASTDDDVDMMKQIFMDKHVKNSFHLLTYFHDSFFFLLFFLFSFYKFCLNSEKREQKLAYTLYFPK